MGKQFVALLCGGIQAHWIVHTVFYAERDFLIAAIDGAGAGINQMLDSFIGIPGRAWNDAFRMPAGLQNIVEPNHIGLDISIRVLNRIPNSSLRSQVHYNIKVILSKELINKSLVRQISPEEKIHNSALA